MAERRAAKGFLWLIPIRPTLYVPERLISCAWRESDDLFNPERFDFCSDESAVWSDGRADVKASKPQNLFGGDGL